MNKPAIIATAAIVLITILAWLLCQRSPVSKKPGDRFRDLVLNQLRTEFPSRDFRANPADSISILVDGLQLGLDNLQRQYEQSDKSDRTLRRLVRDHMTLFSQETRDVLRIPRSLDEARNRLLPQIMPSAIASNTNQVRIALGGGLFSGIVTDEARAYMYLTSDTLEKWGVSKEDACRIALENLDLRSRGLKLQEFKKGITSFIAVGAGDGYDAARIMLPGLRKHLGEKLGFPFNFGVPNRDFLICWSASADEEFRQFVSGRLKEDFQHQPYPISASVFQVAADGTITEQVLAQQARCSEPGDNALVDTQGSVSPGR